MPVAKEARLRRWKAGLGALLVAVVALVALWSPGADGGDAVLLARGELDEVDLPRSSRPEGAATPRRTVAGPFRVRRSGDGVVEHEAALPVRIVRARFGTRQAPPGMRVLDPEGRALVFERDENQIPAAGTWGIDGDVLLLRLGEGQSAEGHRVDYPDGALREDRLNYGTSRLTAQEFAVRTVLVDGESRFGLYLPAPARAARRVRVPVGGVLVFEATVLPPVIEAGVRSDGARVRVEVEDRAGRHEVGALEVVEGAWAPFRADLTAWAGREITVRFVTEPGKDAVLDYVFIAEPAVYGSKAAPRRVLLVFVDTLRADHTSLHGYARDTTPGLRAWSAGAAVFEEARSVAPWTLPAARTALTGDQPERWGEVPTLPAVLAEDGFATAAFVANTFMSDRYDMAEDWGAHRFELLAPAEAQVDRALDWLDRHADRDAALMVHFMDAHLPYRDPPATRGLWAGERPEAIDHLDVNTLRRLTERGEATDEVRDWVTARYDQNIRAVDEALGPLLEAVGDDAVVVLFSDHGEELWDHGDFEHGHTLYDELLRVPLAIRAPGMPAGRVAAPVSLLDLTPTVLDLLGLPARGQGRSLVGAARGDAKALAALRTRPQAFGRPLYRSDAWGVLAGGRKWVVREGKQRVWDVAADPGETHDRIATSDVSAYPGLLADALGREVVTVWRVSGPGDGKHARTRADKATLTHPDGFAATWRAYLPSGGQSRPVLESGAVVLRRGGDPMPREVYALPNGDPGAPGGLVLRIERDGQIEEATVPAGTTWGGPLADPVLLSVGVGGERWEVTFDTVPLPAADDLPAFDEDSLEELRILGYVD